MEVVVEALELMVGLMLAVPPAAQSAAVSKLAAVADTAITVAAVVSYSIHYKPVSLLGWVVDTAEADPPQN